MTLHAMTWTADEAYSFAEPWDALAAGRAGQADPWVTHAWFSGWASAWPDLARHSAVHAVIDAGELVAVWPLVRRGRAWTSANAGNAPRTRLVLREADPRVVDALVRHVVTSGVRALRLLGLPTRDPSTRLLLAALRRHDFEVDVQAGEDDHVVPVADSEVYSRSVRRLVSSARSRERRVSAYWDLSVEEYGGTAGPLEQGVELFERVQSRSWKGAQTPEVAHQRRSFLSEADRHGWVHLLVLRIADRPVAANAWLALGDVAVGWSTCYDQQLGVLAPGQLLHRHVQEQVLESAPALLDVLPGPSPFKDSLGVAREPLVDVAAVRPTGLAGSALVPVRRLVRSAVGEVRRRSGPARGADSATATASSAQALRCVPPGESDLAVTVLETDAAFARYVAVLTGAPSAEAAARGWGEHDAWLLVGEGRALVRLDRSPTPPVVREVLLLGEGTDVEEVAGAVAHAAGEAVGVADLVRTAPPPLPWTEGLAGRRGPLRPCRPDAADDAAP